jgi:tetratricopeptide (TPR) repeat protein
MIAHPSDGELRAFLAGGTARDSRCDQRVVRHLLSRCPSCRARLATLDPEGYWGRARPAPRRPVDYDEVLARAEQTLSLFFIAGRPLEEPPRTLLAELAPAEIRGEQSLQPGIAGSRAIPTLAKWLVAKSHAARFADPKEMLHWGLMAHLAADSCSAEAAGGERRLADLRTRAWGQFGSALRVCGRFREAMEILTTTREYLEAGTGDPTLRARFCEQMATLRICQNDLGSAVDLNDEAEQIYETLVDRQGLASTHVQRAIILLDQAEPEAALRRLDRAIDLLSSTEDPALLLIAQLNRSMAQIPIERPDRVLASFRATFSTDRVFVHPILMLLTCWHEGELLSEVGYFEAAEAKLRAARRGFIARNLTLEVVTATRDLARLYQKTGMRRQLEETLLDTQALYFSIPVEPEVRHLLDELGQMSAA